MGRLRSALDVSKASNANQIGESQSENWSRTKTPVWAGATRHFGRKCRPNVMSRVAPAHTPHVVHPVVRPRPISRSALRGTGY